MREHTRFLEHNDPGTVARCLPILFAKLDEALLILEETGSHYERLVLQVPLLQMARDEAPAEETDRKLGARVVVIFL